jgi:hypothetical protein
MRWMESLLTEGDPRASHEKSRNSRGFLSFKTLHELQQFYLAKDDREIRVLGHPITAL